MPAGFTDQDDDLVAAQRHIDARLDDLGIDHDLTTLAAVSTIFRAADMIRNHMERTVLASVNLSFTAFTVLWVLWIWGDLEARFVAERSGISRGTLTGVVGTLENRGLAKRQPHPEDRRSVIVTLTPAGAELMGELFPEFHAEEQRVTRDVSNADKNQFAETMRTILATVADLNDE